MPGNLLLVHASVDTPPCSPKGHQEKMAKSPPTGFSGVTHPEWTLGDVHASPADDEGVLDGLGGDVDTGEGPVAIVLDFDVNGNAFGILGREVPWVRTNS